MTLEFALTCGRRIGCDGAMASTGPFDVGGISLVELFIAQVDQGKPFTVQEALRIVASLCGRVHAAHVKKNDDGTPTGYVHGALSMPVVWVARDGHVHFIDDPGREPDEPAPEQLAGQPATVASDVFAIGVLLHILLTGGHPFEKETSEPSLLDNRHEFPAELVALVTRSLEREPAQRFATAKAMQAAIEKLFDEPGWGITVADIAQLVENAKATMGRAPKREERVRHAPGDVDCVPLADEDAPPASHSSMAVRLFAEVEALGFRRTGCTLETVKRTGYKVPTVEFSSSGIGAFASVFFSRDAIPMLFFQTDFEDGSFVLTGAYDRQPHRKPRAVCTGQSKQPLAKVLEAHLVEVAAFLARGAKVRAEWDLEARVRSSVAYYENEDRP